MQRVFEKIRAYFPLSDAAASKLSEVVSKCTFAPRQLLVSEGEKRGKAYFIAKGMTRSYWRADGEEFTTSFSLDGALVFSMDEVYFGAASQEYVEAVEAVDAYAIDVDTLRSLWSDDPELCRWGLRIHQIEYRRIHQSHRERLTMPAAERYAAFCRQFPEVVRRARLCDIASYLGLNPSTLSRLRRTQP